MHLRQQTLFPATRAGDGDGPITVDTWFQISITEHQMDLSLE